MDILTFPQSFPLKQIPEEEPGLCGHEEGQWRERRMSSSWWKDHATLGETWWLFLGLLTYSFIFFPSRSFQISALSHCFWLFWTWFCLYSLFSSPQHFHLFSLPLLLGCCSFFFFLGFFLLRYDWHVTLLLISSLQHDSIFVSIAK